MLTSHSTRRAWVLVPIAVALIAIVPASAAKKSKDYWVGTWATALVIRPAGPPAGPPGAGGAAPAGANGPPGAPAGAPRPPPPATVQNQTLRQIVHTSIGGDACAWS